MPPIAKRYLASRIFSAPFARRMLVAKERMWAGMPGFLRMREASSAMVTSRDVMGPVLDAPIAADGDGGHGGGRGRALLKWKATSSLRGVHRPEREERSMRSRLTLVSSGLPLRLERAFGDDKGLGGADFMASADGGRSSGRARAVPRHRTMRGWRGAGRAGCP